MNALFTKGKFLSVLSKKTTPFNHQILLFDIVLLCLNFAMDTTIDVIIGHMYENKEI